MAMRIKIIQSSYGNITMKKKWKWLCTNRNLIGFNKKHVGIGYAQDKNNTWLCTK